MDYKLVNLALIVLIVFLLYKTGNLWNGVLNKFIQILIPFVFAFALAYAVHPFLKKLEEKKLPKWLAVLIIILVILLIIGIVIYLITTVMFNQLSTLFNNIIKFINSIEYSNFDFNVAGLEASLTDTFKNILSNVGKYVSDGAINLVNTSLGVISKIFIIFLD